MPTSLAFASVAGQAGEITDGGTAYVASHQSYGNSSAYNGPPLEVISYAPQRGREGTRVFVQVRSSYSLHSPTGAADAYFLFGSRKCNCFQQFLGFQHYRLSADVPPFLSTGSASFSMPLQIAVIPPRGENNPVVVQVGMYTYEDGPAASSPSNNHAAAVVRKRSLSSISEEPTPSDNIRGRPLKKASTQSLRARDRAADHYASSSSSSYQQQDRRSASYSPYVQPMPTISSYAPFQKPSPSPRASVAIPCRPGLSSTPSSTISAPSPLTPSSWSPPFIALSNGGDTMSSTTGLPMAQRLQQPQQQNAATPPFPSSNPPLVRTSTLQQGIFGQSFNPYAIYPSKASLKLNGDLNSMATLKDWSVAEKESKRRLVQFTRMQNGSTIHADFQAVAPENRAPNSICISCILWEEKGQCFITSVDTIYLLESLVGVRFTVEEKNRIRRNLEGFRPLTISKTKPESEEFFKVIMGFPAPKPRNIEKDVKAFHWNILAHSLKKIIGKYVCSCLPII